MIIELDSENLANRSKVQLWDIPDRIGKNIYEPPTSPETYATLGVRRITKLVGFSFTAPRLTAPRRHPRQLDSAEFLQLSS